VFFLRSFSPPERVRQVPPSLYSGQQRLLLPRCGQFLPSLYLPPPHTQLSPVPLLCKGISTFFPPPPKPAFNKSFCNFVFEGRIACFFFCVLFLLQRISFFTALGLQPFFLIELAAFSATASQRFLLATFFFAIVTQFPPRAPRSAATFPNT